MSLAPLFFSWLAMGLALGWQHRPAPARVRDLAGAGARVVAGARDAARPKQNGMLLLGGLVERLGLGVLRLLRRTPAAGQGRQAGTVVVVVALTLAVVPVAALPAGLIAGALPVLRARRQRRRYVSAIVADLPDVVDLLVLAVGSGLGVRVAVAAVARRAPGPLGAELDRAGQEADLGRRLADALDDIPDRAGGATRPLVAALVASERYGAPLGPGLERLALEVRADRRRRAEEAARKVPVKLLFPLVSCTLPAFGLLTVAPLVASAVQSLRL